MFPHIIRIVSQLFDAEINLFNCVVSLAIIGLFTIIHVILKFTFRFLRTSWRLCTQTYTSVSTQTTENSLKYTWLAYEEQLRLYRRRN